MTTCTTYFPTPLGTMEAALDASGALLRLGFVASAAEPIAADTTPDDPACAGVRRQLDEYFAGARWCFDLPLAPAGTEFQQHVWAALREIPHGETTSYGALAARLGRPGAARAVGRANASNPIAIIVPCHRVVAVDGSAHGYAGGLERKQWLLALERTARADRWRDACS